MPEKPCYLPIINDARSLDSVISDVWGFRQNYLAMETIIPVYIGGHEATLFSAEACMNTIPAVVVVVVVVVDDVEVVWTR